MVKQTADAPRQKTTRHAVYRGQIKATLIAALQNDVVPDDALADLAMTIEDGSFWNNMRAAQAAGGWRGMDVSHLGLPAAATNSLRDGGVRTVGELTELSRAEIIRLPNIAAGTTAKIAIAIARLPHEEPS